MIDLKTQVRTVIKHNPSTQKNTKYLLLSVWERQGLKLWPHQREVFLSDQITTPEAITRARRHVLND